MNTKELRETNYKLITYADGSTPKNRHYYNLFAESYNKVSKSNTPVQALSHLSQIKQDIYQERDQIYDSLLYVKGQLDELIERGDQQNQSVVRKCTVINETMLSLLRGGYKVYQDNQYVVDSEQLKSAISNLEQTIAVRPLNDFETLVDNAFTWGKELTGVNAQYVGLTDVISAVIREGYPSSIETYNSDQEYQEEQKTNRLGRPLDIPQEPIEKRVTELIEKGKNQEPGYKKYWHHEGSRKGNPNINQIAITLIDDGLVGEISMSTIKRRINKVIANGS